MNLLLRFPPACRANNLARFALRQITLILVVALSVAFGLVLLFRQSIGSTLVYCFCITICCSLCIQGLHRIVTRLLRNRGSNAGTEERLNWSGWPVMIITLLIGTAVGYSAGNELANWFTGSNERGLLGSSAREVLTLMLISLVPGLAVTYFFVSRSRLDAAELRVQTAQRQAAETQLRLLESQLEPHMLFNTLANLRVLIGIDPPRAQAMLDHMIAFLRATLTASRNSTSHSLREEFARLQDYLALMRVRMGERLQPVFDLPADVAELPVPPLLLQPLVENAIQHGLEPALDGGELRVSARRDGGQLILEVRDSGVGLKAAAASPGTHFGLHQVRERLATRYGAAATLRIDPAPGAGTVVTLHLPLS